MQTGYYWWEANKLNSEPEVVYVYNDNGFTMVKRFHGMTQSGCLVSILNKIGRFIDRQPIRVRR